MKRILLASITALCCTLAGADEHQALPDFGSSAGTLLSPLQEKSIGRQMLREMRGSNLILDDALTADYLEHLGYRLVASSDRPDQDFTFFVVNANDINAFAVPGGYVGVNAGLITTAENESELAAVLGHEIAHVTQHHLERAYESLSKVALPLQLAMLGALLIAGRSNSPSAGNAAEAVIVSGSALLQQSAINFTRANESEADRIGIRTMARSGFDPEAMSDFFGRMGRALRSNGEAPPPFLMTHPVTTIRIAEAKDRAAAMKTERDSALAAEKIPAPSLTLAIPPIKPGAAAAPAPPEVAPFLLFRERVRALSAEAPRELLTYYDNAAPTPSNRYGRALALSRAQRPEDAAPVLAELVKRFPTVTAFAIELARAEIASGRQADGEKRLEKLYADHPGHRQVGIAYGEMLTQRGEAKAAKRAIEVLRPIVADNGEDPNLQLTFARASELAGDEIRAGEAHAELALLNGRLNDALLQLQALLKRGDADYYQRARIEARIAEVTPYAIEQHKYEQQHEPKK
jgi:predicted Zn-dependent protease